MSAINYSVYVVTDAPERYPRGLLAGVEGALAGGATLVQYRQTSGTRFQLYETALQLRDLVHHHGVPFIVNDHVDLAIAVDADGVHVGQSDLPTNVVRRLIGRGKLIGWSLTAVEQLAAVGPEVDYLGVGPVFATPTKPNAATPLGLHTLREIAATTALPVVAIGGINLTNVGEVFETGVDGVAVVSAVSQARDPAGIVRQLIAGRRPAH